MMKFERENGNNRKDRYRGKRRLLCRISIFSLISLIGAVLIVDLLSVATIAQRRRPVLQRPQQDYFAGKFLFISRDASPSSLQQPDMVAKIADHDFIKPPGRLLGDSAKLFEWAKNVDFDQIDGAIISIDALIAGSDEEAAIKRLELFRDLRRQRPHLPIYAYIEIKAPQAILAPLFNLASKQVIDHLLLIADPADYATLKSRISGLDQSAPFSVDDAEGAAMNLTALMINQRFGFSPRILPVYSSATGRDGKYGGGDLQLNQVVHNKVRAIGGFAYAQSSQATRGVDILLFIHTPQTSGEDLKAFVKAIAQTIEKNVRIGVADLSDSRESKEALFEELKRLKLLDKIVSYASTDSEKTVPDDALSRSLSQASAFLAALKFLRDDLPRIRRVDRAHLSLLISRFLTDLSYNNQIRPKLRSYIREDLKADSISSASLLERAESFALEQFKPLADELFNLNFRRNVHGFLLSNGERTQFEVRLLQRIQLHLFARPEAPQNIEIEINPAVYLAHLGNRPSPAMQYGILWELHADRVDERVAAKWDSIEWTTFKGDVEQVEMHIKLAPQPNAAAAGATAEGYAIASKKSRSTRRIEVTAPTAQGAFAAVGKLRQMGAEGLFLKDFQLTESPAFANRGVIDSYSGHWSHSERIKLIQTMGAARLNRYYFIEQLDRTIDNKDIEKIKELTREANYNFIQFVYGLGFDSDDEVSYDNELAVIYSKIDLIASLGVTRFLIDFRKGGSDKGNPTSALQAKAHANLVNRVREYLKRKNNAAALFVIPAHSHDQTARAAYLKELVANLPTEIEIITKAMADLAATIGRPVTIIDGFSEIGPICLGRLTPSDSLQAPNVAGLAISLSPYFQASIIRLEMAAELAWEGRQFDSQRALDRALTNMFDERSRAAIIAWAKILGDCRDKHQLSDNSVVEMLAAIDPINATPDRGLLRGEIIHFMIRNRARQ